MATISSGSVTFTINAGEQYRVIATGEAYVDIGGGSTESYRLINGASERLLGGFIVATPVTIRVVSGSVEYINVSGTGDSVALSLAQSARSDIIGVAAVSSDGNIYDAAGNKIQLTSPAYDSVTLSASTTAVRSAPTLISGFTCTASASGNITLYANTANSGTVIWSGAVTAGQTVTFPTPYQSFLGVSFQLVSGTATINLSVK